MTHPSIAAGWSNQADFDAACQEACVPLQQMFASEPPDVVLVFVSHAHAEGFDRIGAAIQSGTRAQLVLGCTGEGIIGGNREFENQPAIAVWGARLPGAEIIPFGVDFDETPDGMVCSGVPEGLQERQAETRLILLLAEPFSSSPKALIDLFADELPHIPVVGGMASGGGPGSNRLFWNSRTMTEGAAGVVIRGGTPVRTLVSQGCRPIGQPYIVTKADRNIVLGLGGETPLARLQEMFPQLSTRDQVLFEQGLFLGVAISEYRDRFERGDFLISNVLGADRSTGAIALGNLVRVGQTVQFHLRDAAAADEDLTHLLTEFHERHPQTPAGGLLFTCNGRGRHMFPENDHDASAVQQHLGPFPVAGMFAAGEFGPVGSQNYIHGFTASLALFMANEQ